MSSYLDDFLNRQSPQAKAAQKLLAEGRQSIGKAPARPASATPARPAASLPDPVRAKMKHARDLLRGGYDEGDVASFCKMPVPTLRNLLKQYGLN